LATRLTAISFSSIPSELSRSLFAMFSPCAREVRAFDYGIKPLGVVV
jgi:hypothetical protein